jgi:hypothetical protein
MQKSTWLMTMVGLFLAAALIWAVPVFAQPQGGPGGCGRGYNQGAGGLCGGGPGYCATNNNSQTCPGYGNGYGQQYRGRNRARWNNNSNNNNVQTPANPQPQTQTPAPPSGN